MPPSRVVQDGAPDSPPRSPWRIFLVIVSATLLVLAVLNFSFRSGHHMTAKYTPLIDAAMEIRLEATMAHLWLEEILSGDASESFEGVLTHIDNANWYANAMLQGGENSEGVFLPLSDPAMRQEIQTVIEQLALFRQITIERYNAMELARSGSEIDRSFDETFRRFSERADKVETKLQRLIAEELRDFELLHYLLLSLCALLGVLVFVLFYRYERQRAEHLSQIYASNKQLDRMSLTDGLTGIPNRRFFDKYLEQELKRAARDRTWLTLAILDVDFFKRYNDRHGHVAGDSCLKLIAQTLESLCKRPADVVARYGGEEFAVILPNTDDLQSLLHGFRESIEALAIPHGYSPASDVVTISVGYFSTIPDTDVAPEDLIRQADDALYQAKDSGRNRVINASEAPIAVSSSSQIN